VAVPISVPPALNLPTPAPDGDPIADATLDRNRVFARIVIVW
jgi:hypothetical protein